MVFAPGCHLLEEREFWLEEGKRVENLFQRNNLLSLITKPIALFLIGVIRIYQLFISPFLGANCRFQPTCSHYVIESLQKKSFSDACLLIVKRISRCHPFNEGGFDPLKK